MPGVTYPPPGAPEYQLASVSQYDSRLRAAKRLAQRKRRKKKQDLAVQLPAGFGEISTSQAAREWGEQFEAAKRVMP